MPGKHHLRGFKIANKIGSPLRGSWTMLRIVVGSNPLPLGKKLDPPLLAQALCKMRWISPGDLARSPNCNPIENNTLKRCREVIEGDGGPINYWTLHSLWCLLKEKHGVTCKNDAINGNMRDSLVIRVEADTNHKSARFFFTPFVIKCMISQ